METLFTPNDSNQWFEFATGLSPSNGMVTFDVEASSNAHVALGPSSVTYGGGRYIDDHYEIVLGGWKNTQSVVRYENLGPNEIKYPGNVLKFRKFRISWHDITSFTLSALKVEFYSDYSGWVEMIFLQPVTAGYTIDRAMVMTGYGSTGLWTLETTGAGDWPTSQPSDPPSASYMLACGASYASCTGISQSADSEELHHLRCCADSNLNNAWTRSDLTPDSCPSGVYGASDFPDGGMCYPAVTFHQGKNICEAEGGRLCTYNEVMSDCTLGSGCEYNYEMVWTSTIAE
eukprot:CAMPEP_0183705790 /NCGR_PEP_ID=MMETSP0737-20130205/2813_1 /TAXON_ID=385413 /ORGANISM="Thalassiosira miniscula, Strain CCMP1093" /LENGTH=287 /DNA_ID=CAMNT_0025933041 /DNA_START=194 /DNA_END=1057 /DNA_ORIENTATION=-